MRLWARLAAGLLPVAVLAMLGMALATYRATLDVLRRRAAEQARSLAIGASVPEAVRGLRLRSEELLLPVLQRAVVGGALEAAALLPDGRVLAHTDVARVGARLDDEALRRALETGAPAMRLRDHSAEATAAVREVEESEEFLLAGRGRSTVGAIRVVVPLAHARQTAHDIVRRELLMVAGLSLLIIGTVVFWLRRALIPLDRLAEAARRVEEGDVGATVEVRGTDEVAELGRRFNSMSRALRETTVSRAYVGGVLDAMADGLLVTGADGLVRLSNPAARRLLGYDPAGKALSEVLPAAPGPGRSAETDFGGLSVLCSAAALPDGGVVTTLRDITARKRAEHELARSNAELEQFAFVASHDLQEPLRKVSSYCQLVQRRYAGKLDKDADDFLRFAVEGAGRMKELITDLLAYSRVGRGGQTFAPVRLDDTVRAALDALDESVREAGARVEVGPLPTLMGHEPSLRQLFQNLIGNAVKFRRPDVPARVSVTAEKRDGEWLVKVTDNGIGIPPQHRDRVFVLFQRLHPKSRYPGTGIGLAICRRVVETHRGRIWVEEAPGGGSVFNVVLPETRDG